MDINPSIINPHLSQANGGTPSMANKGKTQAMDIDQPKSPSAPTPLPQGCGCGLCSFSDHIRSTHHPNRPPDPPKVPICPVLPDVPGRKANLIQAWLHVNSRWSERFNYWSMQETYWLEKFTKLYNEWLGGPGMETRAVSSEIRLLGGNVGQARREIAYSSKWKEYSKWQAISRSKVTVGECPPRPFTFLPVEVDKRENDDVVVENGRLGESDHERAGGMVVEKEDIGETDCEVTGSRRAPDQGLVRASQTPALDLLQHFPQIRLDEHFRAPKDSPPLVNRGNQTPIQVVSRPNTMAPQSLDQVPLCPPFSLSDPAQALWYSMGIPSQVTQTPQGFQPPQIPQKSQAPMINQSIDPRKPITIVSYEEWIRSTPEQRQQLSQQMQQVEQLLQPGTGPTRQGPIQGPAQQLTQKPVKSTQKRIQKPRRESIQGRKQQSTQRLVQKSAQRRAYQPAQQPTQRYAQGSSQGSSQKPAQKSIQRSMQPPSQRLCSQPSRQIAQQPAESLEQHAQQPQYPQYLHPSSQQQQYFQQQYLQQQNLQQIYPSQQQHLQPGHPVQQGRHLQQEEFQSVYPSQQQSQLQPVPSFQQQHFQQHNLQPVHSSQQQPLQPVHPSQQHLEPRNSSQQEQNIQQVYPFDQLHLLQLPPYPPDYNQAQQTIFHQNSNIAHESITAPAASPSNLPTLPAGPDFWNSPLALQFLAGPDQTLLDEELWNQVLQGDFQGSTELEGGSLLDFEGLGASLWSNGSQNPEELDVTVIGDGYPDFDEFLSGSLEGSIL